MQKLGINIYFCFDFYKLKSRGGIINYEKMVLLLKTLCSNKNNFL